MVENLTDIAPIGRSDHVGLTWTYVCSSDISTREDETGGKLNYSKGDCDKMNDSFRNIDWEEKMEKLDCEDAWQFLKQAYEHAVDEHVLVRKKRKKNKPPWMGSHVKKSVKRKHSLYQKYRKSKQYQDYEEYKKTK